MIRMKLGGIWIFHMSLLFSFAVFPINLLSCCRFFHVACTCTGGPTFMSRNFVFEFSPGTCPPIINQIWEVRHCDTMYCRAAVSLKNPVSQLQLPFHPYQVCNANVGHPECSQAVRRLECKGYGLRWKTSGPLMTFSFFLQASSSSQLFPFFLLFGTLPLKTGVLQPS